MITDLVHPDYNLRSKDWDKWRLAYEGGTNFISKYLRRISKREDEQDYKDRLALTYCPAFAKAAVNEIRDAIYQRMADISRKGGSRNFHDSCEGLLGGIDLEGSSMNYFMGCKVLPELLVVGDVGIYVDMPLLSGESITAASQVHPYIYSYRTEDIRSWNCDPNNPNDFTSVLLREFVHEYDDDTGLPCGCSQRFRFLWKDESGLIFACFYNSEGQKVDQFGTPITDPILLEIDEIPFVRASIGESLLTDIADYQIALLNLASIDMAWAARAGMPIYTEQYDPKTVSNHLRPPGDSEDAESAKTQEIKVGMTRGRKYPKGMDRPGFIHPSADPIKASMEKQAQLKEEIRQLLKLTISSLQGPKMASADSKKQDSASLETGLSYIGLALEMAERQITKFWQMYEGTGSAATINYPTNYSLRTEEDRRQEAKELEESITKIPSMTFQKEMAKRSVEIRLGNKIAKNTLDLVKKEIDASPTMTSDPEVIAKDIEVGLVSLELASKIRGYPSGEVEQAKKDHAERLARIAVSQQQDNPAARGNPDASANPKEAASQEKKESRDNTDKGVVKDRTRGPGK